VLAVRWLPAGGGGGWRTTPVRLAAFNSVARIGSTTTG
jgi:hypothetical protein